MPSTASSVRGWRRIGMGVPKLSIWGHRGRICFTKRRISGTHEKDRLFWFVGIIKRRRDCLWNCQIGESVLQRRCECM